MLYYSHLLKVGMQGDFFHLYIQTQPLHITLLSAKLSLRHPSITCVAVASFDNGLPETSRTLFSLTCSSYSKYVVLWQQCYVQMQRLRLDLDMIQITVYGNAFKG